MNGNQKGDWGVVVTSEHDDQVNTHSTPGHKSQKCSNMMVLEETNIHIQVYIYTYNKLCDT